MTWPDDYSDWGGGPCNRCTLTRMERRAAERGVTVILTKEGGWTNARYSDRDEPSAGFMSLSEGCVC